MDLFLARPVQEVFEYLADPRNRPEWQSSLGRVELLDDGPPRAGMRWVDHPRIGPPFAMEIGLCEPHRLWTERGRSGPFSATVVQTFEEATRQGVVGTLLRCAVEVRGRGLAKPLGWLATGIGVLLARSDLRRAARILEARPA